jgi:hypothetical protein
MGWLPVTAPVGENDTLWQVKTGWADLGKNCAVASKCRPLPQFFSHEIWYCCLQPAMELHVAYILSVVELVEDFIGRHEPFFL